MPKYIYCKHCDRDRIGKSFTHDKEMCNDCYTEYKHHQFVVYGVEWDRVCKDCLETKNVFTDFHKPTNSIPYSFTCNKCKSIYDNEKSNRNYKSKKKFPTGDKKIDFKNRFSKVFS